MMLCSGTRSARLELKQVSGSASELRATRSNEKHIGAQGKLLVPPDALCIGRRCAFLSDSLHEQGAPLLQLSTLSLLDPHFEGHAACAGWLRSDRTF